MKRKSVKIRRSVEYRIMQSVWSAGFIGSCLLWLVCGCCVAETNGDFKALAALLLVSIAVRTCYGKVASYEKKASGAARSEKSMQRRRAKRSEAC